MTKARDTANLTGSGVTLPLLDIDAGTDIGAALVDADLMIVDDGAGGTNRKATMSRLATYMGTKIGGGMEFITSTGAISNAASADFTGFDSSKYDHYVFYFQHVIPATDDKLLLGRIAVSGTSYDATNGNYHSSSNTDRTGLVVADNVGSDSNEFGVSGKYHLFSPHTAAYTYGASETLYIKSDGVLYARESLGDGRSVHLNAAAVTAIQFLYDSGNIESGEITMFGIVNS